MYYLYVLKSKVDNKLYIGSTNNLKRRFAKHNNKLSPATRNRAPFILIYYEAYVSKKDAIAREINLKKFNNTYKRLKERIKNCIST